MEKNSYNLNYLRMIPSVVLIAMLFTILFSIVIRGTSKNTKTEINNNDKDINSYNVDNNSVTKYKEHDKNPVINIYLSESKKIIKIKLEDYVAGVIAGEMPANFETEALKAQAVAVRTYALSHLKEFGGIPCSNAQGADLCNTVHCQVYMTKEERYKNWPASQADKLWNKIITAVKDTSSQVLTYDDNLVMEPYYFAISSGKTEDSTEVFSRSIPYLKSVSSPGEEIADKFKSSKTYTYSNFISIINSNFSKAKVTKSDVKNQVKILEFTTGGNVKEVKAGGVSISGTKFRKIFSLNSTHFSINFDTSKVVINCLGYGHDIGMSQWGANVMAKDGKKYIEILEHYYQGIKVKEIGQFY